MLFDSERLQFFNAQESFREQRNFGQFLERMKAHEWVVYAKRPFAGPQQVLDYVGRYTHRVAISNNRLLDIENGSGALRMEGLSGWWTRSENDDLVRRRVHPAFLAARSTGWIPAHPLLRFSGKPISEGETGSMSSSARHATPRPQPMNQTEKDYRDGYEELTGSSLRECPQCQQGRMVVIETATRLQAPTTDNGFVMITGANPMLRSAEPAWPCHAKGSCGHAGRPSDFSSHRRSRPSTLAAYTSRLGWNRYSLSGIPCAIPPSPSSDEFNTHRPAQCQRFSPIHF